MPSIGIFFASETGNTAEIARLIQSRYLPSGSADVHDLEVTDAAQIAAYDRLIFGTSTMGCGEYPAALEAFLPELDEIDFHGKTVALFGLGDQYGYPGEFCDALGLLYEELLRREAHVVGFWPTAGYEYEASQADLGDGSFCGLVLDEDNQPELTGHRLSAWIEAIRGDLLPTNPAVPLRQQAPARAVAAGRTRAA
jgi:flavodoxin I